MVAMRTDNSPRLNVLLTDGQKSWSSHLPRLLEPQGVQAFSAETVNEALEVIQSHPIHVAVVDITLPMNRHEGKQESHRPVEDRFAGGLRLLRVIQGLNPRPPSVVVRGRAFDQRDPRVLREALNLGAFSVLDQPIDLEQMLRVLQRVLERHYGGSWPGCGEQA